MEADDLSRKQIAQTINLHCLCYSYKPFSFRLLLGNDTHIPAHTHSHTLTPLGVGRGTGVCLSVWWIEEMSDELERDPIGWVSLSKINMFELQTFRGSRFQLKLQLRSCDHLLLHYPYHTIEFFVYTKFVCMALCTKTKEISHYEYKLGTGEASLLQRHLKICVCPW